MANRLNPRASRPCCSPIGLLKLFTHPESRWKKAIAHSLGLSLSVSLSIGINIDINLGLVELGDGRASAATTAEEYRLQGLAYRQQGNYPKAIAAMETAVELAPDDPAGHLLLGWTQHLADQPIATATLGHALALDPFSVQAANALGIAYLVRARLNSAIVTHLWATYLKSDNEIAYFNLSLAAHRIQYDDWAIELAAQAVSLEPNNPHPKIARAIASWSQGDRLSKKVILSII